MACWHLIKKSNPYRLSTQNNLQPTRMMDKITLKELAFPLIKSIDSFNFLLKHHHRRVAVIAYFIGTRLKLEENRLADLVLAAALHDIGALSVQERDMLIQKDVLDPMPHCLMGYKMLSSCHLFSNIALIIKHHHIQYRESEQNPEAPLESHIIHLADRIDIHIDQDLFILDQKEQTIKAILDNCGSVFHPDTCQAFSDAAQADIFWIELVNMTMEQLLKRIHYTYDCTLSLDQIMEFATVVSRIIDFRSTFTAGHSYSVAHIAAYLGRKCGLNEDACTKLMLAGLFHDIGKIGIDTAYIEKPGPLTHEEFNQMKLHTYYTYQILNELSLTRWFEEVVIWSSNHHEKSDGNGYPYRKNADDLDLGTRILTYSDILTALMEKRPYREASSIDTAIEILKLEVAPILYPEILETIEANKSGIVQILNRCATEIEKVYTTSVTGS